MEGDDLAAVDPVDAPGSGPPASAPRAGRTSAAPIPAGLTGTVATRAAATTSAVAPDDPRARWASWVLVVAGCAYLLVLVPGARWFAGDDWFVLADQPITRRDALLEDINGHWILLPRLAFAALWAVSGLDAYWQFKALAVAVHGSVAVLLRAVMVRGGVRPWPATVALVPFVLLGAGWENMLWPIQVQLTGAIAFGLGQLLLAERPGPLRRGDVTAVAVGTAGALCSGVVLPVTAAVVLAVWLRRGPAPAAVHALPAAVFAISLVMRDDSALTGGIPSPAVLVAFAAEGLRATATALGYNPMGALVILALVVGALVASLGPWLQPDGVHTVRDRAARSAVPLSLLAGSVGFNLLTAPNAPGHDPGVVWAVRYVYVGVALALPAVVLGADLLARRVPVVAPALLAFAVLSALGGLSFLRSADPAPMDPDRDRRILAAAIASPLLDGASDSVDLFFDPFHLRVDAGFVRVLRDQGKLEPASTPPSAAEEAALRVRLGLDVEPLPAGPDRAAVREPVAGCEPVEVPGRLSTEPGDEFSAVGPLSFVLHADGVEGDPVPLEWTRRVRIRVEAPGLDLGITGTGSLCRVPTG